MKKRNGGIGAKRVAIETQDNIVEYESDRDELNFDTLLKAEAYACLYKCDEKHFEERPYEEITMTLIRKSKPRGLFQYLDEVLFAKFEPRFACFH